jgi:hypothetical protein
MNNQLQNTNNISQSVNNQLQNFNNPLQKFLMNYLLQKYDHECEIIEIKDEVCIECDNCIFNLNYYIEENIECNCEYKTINKNICKKCEEIKYEIKRCKENSVDLATSIHYEIGNYENYYHKLTKLNELSQKIRILNKILLKKI